MFDCSATISLGGEGNNTECVWSGVSYLFIFPGESYRDGIGTVHYG